MKRIIQIIIVTIIVFILFIMFFMHLFNGQTYSITGSVEDAVLDSNGNIVIIEEDVTEQPSYITYTYGGVKISLLAIRNSKGKVVVVINTCQSCDNSSNAYYLLKDDKLECKSCNIKIDVDKLDNLEYDSCNPIMIEEIKNENGKIIIGTKQLQELKDRFENWNGPK